MKSLGEIEEAITIVVRKRGAGGPSAATHVGLLRDVGKRSVAVIAIQDVAAVTGEQQVVVATGQRKQTGRVHPCTKRYYCIQLWGERRDFRGVGEWRYQNKSGSRFEEVYGDERLRAGLE